MKALLWFTLFLSLGLWATDEVPVATLVGTINPGTGSYLVSEIDKAEKAKAPYLLVVLDTPGGLLSTTRQMVQKILDSPLPVVVFVGPDSARAGSAGALLVLAADVAAMAPSAKLGAAGSASADPKDSAEDTKLSNEAAVLAETIAKARGRNRDWAVKAVREGAGISSEEAIKQGLVDSIAENPAALSAQLSGFRFKAPKGNVTQIQDGAVVLSASPMGLWYQALSFLANPSLAYLILALGSVCFWWQFANPGRKASGIAGIFCFLVGLSSFQLLPISYAALGLLLAGLCLILAELFFPAYGLMGIGGTLSYLLGSLFLMDTPAPEFQIPLKLILPTAAALAAIASFLGYRLLERRRASPLLGADALIGQYAEVKEMVTPQKGKVFVQGELWNAFSAAEALEFSKGSVVVVEKVEGMHLIVGPSHSV